MLHQALRQSKMFNLVTCLYFISYLSDISWAMFLVGCPFHEIFRVLRYKSILKLSAQLQIVGVHLDSKYSVSCFVSWEAGSCEVH